MKKKLNKILRSLSQEGPTNYFRRIYGLGRYRYFVRQVLLRNRLKSKHALINGYQLRLPPRRQGIVEELILYGIHEPMCTELYRTRLSFGDIVLDVGTNIGYYLAIASSEIGTTGCIYGFEPDEELFSCAVDNAGGFDCQVHLHNKAVSAKSGTVLFHVSEVANWGSIRRRNLLRPCRSINVESITIDSFCSKNGVTPNMIRMDIEGGEVEALEGARKVLSSVRPNLFIEIHTVLITHSELKRILKLLKLSGYSHYVVVDRYFDWPWSNERFRRESVSYISHEELESIANNGRLPNVVGVFAGRFD